MPPVMESAEPLSESIMTPQLTCTTAPPVAEKAVCLAVIFGSVLRTVLGVSHQRSLKPIAVYGKIVRLAGRQLFFGQREVEELSLP